MVQHRAVPHHRMEVEENASRRAVPHHRMEVRRAVPHHTALYRTIEPAASETEVEEPDEADGTKSKADEEYADVQESVKEEAERFASKWLGQNGRESGIPRRYTPCRYFFKANGCQNEAFCQFSHNKLFHEERFATMLRNHHWDRREKKTFLQTHPSKRWKKHR